MAATPNAHLQRLALRLQEVSREHPANDTLKDAITLLSNIDLSDPREQSTAWHALEADMNTLTRTGAWSPTREDHELLELLKTGLNSTGIHAHNDMSSQETHQIPQRYSVVTPPPISAPLFPPTAGVTTILPAGLIEVLNYSYFLHLLVTDPDRVLPPGKSLLSVMSKPQSMGHDGADGELPKLKDRIQDVVHRAFWDEAYEMLSNPSAAVQLPRIKRLYEDLHEAIKPLIPANHPILLVLTCPLSPTSFPLRSAVTHLRELLVCLRSRCAPIRDAQIDALIRNIDDLSSLASIPDIARLVVNTVREILELSELMKEDLSQFVVGSMSEKQLRAVLMVQAAKQERDVVFSLWRPNRVQELWGRWLDGRSAHEGNAESGPQERVWVHRLMEALGLSIPVSCPLPTKPTPGDAQEGSKTEPTVALTNLLPPPLFFVYPTLLYIQNYLQALVIAATLRSLVRLPAHKAKISEGMDESDQQTFTSRIWTLLRAEIDEQPGSGDTKLVNLADEVIRVRRKFNATGDALDADEEGELRAAVDRTLQPHDPVFALLQKRLLVAIAKRLAYPTAVSSPRSSTVQLPERLQSGRERAGKRPRLGLALDHDGIGEDGIAAGTQREESLVVKGFEDDILVKAMGEGLSRLRSCVEWTEQVWPDLMKTGSLGST